MTKGQRKDDEPQSVWAVLVDSKKTLAAGTVLGAGAGALTGGLLTIIILFGLMGSGHGGSLEGTGLEPVAWALVNSGPVLAESLGLGTDGWEFCGVLPYGTIIGALIGVCVTVRRLAKSDRRNTDPEPVQVAEWDTEPLVDTVRDSDGPEERCQAMAQLKKLEVTESLEGDNDE